MNTELVTHLLDGLKEKVFDSWMFDSKRVGGYISTLYKVIPRVPALEQTRLVELLDQLELFQHCLELYNTYYSQFFDEIEYIIVEGERE